MIFAFIFLQASPTPPLNITCIGGGTANKFAMRTIQGYNSGSGMAGTTPFSYSGNNSATISQLRQQGFTDQVDIRLFAGDDRIRMPRTMLPPIHGGDDGWFKLKDVKVDARSIRAKVGVNFLNSPKVYIDRTTGTISISGKSGDYTGACEAVAGDAPQKF